jgi:DNA replication protein DnaC
MQTQLADLCKQLRLPGVARNAERAAQEAARQGTEHMDFLTGLLQVEVDERQARRYARRVKEAGFPVVKTLAGFDFKRAPTLPQTRIRRLFDGEWIRRAEPILFLGEPGTGKTHLATALGEAAIEKGYRVKFTSAASLVTELVEARDTHVLGRVIRRYSRVDVLIIDELAYIPLARSDAELLFRVLGERNELRPIVITTNLPFSEWTSMFPDPRLCRALVDRLVHRAHIIETGQMSQRLAETLKRQTTGGSLDR